MPPQSDTANSQTGVCTHAAWANSWEKRQAASFHRQPLALARELLLWVLSVSLYLLLSHQCK